jgi:hypothetical protein
MLLLYVGGVSGLMWASVGWRLRLIYRGGCIAKQPPRLILINRGGYLKMTASVNLFCKAVFYNRLG